MAEARESNALTHWLADVIETFERHKALAERAMAQVPEDRLGWRPDGEANSIAILVRHLSGNLNSRFTDFLTTDGEKPWRHRDREFEPPGESREALMERWEAGWRVLSESLRSLGPEDALRIVSIRGQDHTVIQALHRALAHGAYHVGQIVQLARQIVGAEAWQTLSIARGKSSRYQPLGRI